MVKKIVVKFETYLGTPYEYVLDVNSKMNHTDALNYAIDFTDSLPSHSKKEIKEIVLR